MKIIFLKISPRYLMQLIVTDTNMKKRKHNLDNYFQLKLTSYDGDPVDSDPMQSMAFSRPEYWSG